MTMHFTQRTSVLQTYLTTILPRGASFLREFNFAKWRFLCFAGTNFLRLENAGFCCLELIFAIF